MLGKAVLLFSFVVIACSQSISLSETTTTEDIMRAGTFVQNIILTGSTWNTITSSIETDLINGYTANAWPLDTLNFQFGFRNRRSQLMQSGCFSLVSSTQLKVTFSADTQYNIGQKENITIKIPASAVSNGRPPQRITWFISPSSGTVSMQSYSFTEALIRQGGQVITITLSSQETWIASQANMRLIANATTGTSSSVGLWNFVRSRYQPMPLSAFSFQSQNLVITLGAATSYDCTTDEVVTIDIPAKTVRSGLKPSGTLTFTIKASLGYFYLPNPTIIRETQLLRGQNPAVSLTFTLDVGETWSSGIDGNTVITQLTSSRSDTFGFNNRKGVLLQSSNVVRLDTYRLKITFTTDNLFDIISDETVTFTALSSFTTSGIQPLKKTGSSFSDQFTIQAQAGIVKWSVNKVSFTETNLLTSGYAITFTLQAGETWVTGLESSVLAAITASTTQTNGWNNQKTTLLPLTTTPKAVTYANTNHDIVLTFAANSLYDIASTEKITFVPTTTMTSSAKLPSNTSISFFVTPTAGTISISHATKTAPLSFTEDEVRQGMGVITLTWAQGETWSGVGFSAFNISADTGQNRGWKGRTTFRQYLLSSSRITYANNQRSMLLNIKGDPEYDISTQENLYVRIIRSATASRLLPSPAINPDKFFPITVTVTAGKVTVVCCSTYTERDIGRGGKFLKLRLSYGETWVDGFSQGIVSAMTSNRNDEPNGWQQRVSYILPTSLIKISNNSRDLTFFFNQDPLYDLEKYSSETITVNLNIATFPAGAIKSGLQIQPTSISFTIFRDAGIVNVTNTLVLTEKQINQGGALIRFRLSTWETWDNGQAEAIRTAMVSDKSETTGFNALKTSIIPIGGISIPSSKTGYTVRITTSAASTYDITAIETVKASFTTTVFKGSTTPTPVSFTITVSAGEMSSYSPTTMREAAIRSGASVLTFTLNGWEKWQSMTTTIANAIIAAITSDQSHSTGFITLRNTILTTSSFSISGQTLTMTLSAAATYDIWSVETLTFRFPSTATMSGIQTTAVTIKIYPSPGTLVTSPTSFSVSDYSIRTVEAGTSFTLVLTNEQWKLTTSCWRYTFNASTQAINFKSDQTYARGFVAFRRNRLYMQIAPNTNSMSLIVTVLKQAKYDISLAETITFQPNRTCYRSGILPSPAAITFKITPNPGTLTMSPTTFTEQSIQTGTAVLTLTLSSDSDGWSKYPYLVTNGMTSSRTSVQEPYGWESLRKKLFPLDSMISQLFYKSMFSWSVSGKVLRLRLAHSDFDINAAETITLNPSFESTGGRCWNGTQAPTASPSPLIFTITPTAPTLLIQPTTFFVRENSLRSGVIKFNLTLSRWEQWVDSVGARQAIIQGMSSNLLVGFGASARGFNAIKSGRATNNLLIANSKFMFLKDRWTYVIKFNSTSFYETSQDETITITLPGSVFKSGLSPSNTVSFKILNEVGITVLTQPSSVTEAQIRAGVTVKFYIFRSQTYKPNNVTWTDDILWYFPNYATSNKIGIDTFGFNNRKSILYKYTALTITTPARVFLNAIMTDASFDNSATETVSFNFPDFSNSLRSIPKTGTTLTITPTAGVLSLSPTPYTVSEDSVRTGKAAFNISLAVGETWKSSALSVLLSVFSSNKNDGFGFNALRSTLLTTSSFKIRGRNLEVRLNAISTYDILADETISFTIPSSVMSSGLTPSPTSLSFSITVARQFVTLTPYPMTTLTEAQIRTGGVTFTLTLTTGEKWTTTYSTFLTGFAATTSQTNGFNARRSSIITTTSFTALDSYRLKVTLLSASSTYDITTQEYVWITIPSTMVESGLVPRTVQKLYFNISATLSTVTLLSPNYVTEAGIRKGTAILTFVISEDTWATDYSNMIGGMTSSKSETTGFNARKSTLLLPAGFSITQSSTYLKIQFQPDTLYDINEDETIKFPIPPGGTTSGRTPTNSPFTFQILRAYQVFNTSTIQMKDIRAGRGKLQIVLYNDNWVSGKQSVAISSFSASSDSLGNGFSAWRSTILKSAYTYFTGRTLVLQIQATPLYTLCASTEKVSFTFSDDMFDSAKGTKQSFSFNISATPSSMSITRGDKRDLSKSVVIREDYLRTNRYGVNISVSYGSWTSTSETFRSAMTGSLSTVYGFNARKATLCPSSGCVQVAGSNVRFLFRVDRDFNIDGNETVSIQISNQSTSCYSSSTNLSFVILGRKAQVQSASLLTGGGTKQVRSATIWAGDLVTVVFRGYELMPKLDSAVLVTNSSSCASPTIINSTLGFKSLIKGTIVSELNWTLPIKFPGRFKFCYKVNGSSTYAALSYPQITVLAAVRSMDALPVWVNSNVSTLFTFRGVGLNQTAGGDVVKLISVSEGETCSSPGYYTSLDTRGTDQAANVLQFNYLVNASGRYAWCYRLYSSPGWYRFQAFNVTSIFTSYSPQFFEPNIAGTINITGFGIDTRSLLRRADAAGIALASGPGLRHGNCSKQLLQLFTDLGPDDTRGRTSASISFTALLPGYYTLCVRSGSRNWAPLGTTFRVYSTALAFTPNTVLQGGKQYSFNVSGVGIRAFPNAALRLKIVETSQTCSYDAPLITVTRTLNDLQRKIQVAQFFYTFTYASRFLLCWSTLERGTWKTFSKEIVVVGGIGSFSPLSVFASDDFSITITGASLNPKRMVSWLIPRGRSCFSLSRGVSTAFMVETDTSRTSTTTQTMNIRSAGLYTVCVNASSQTYQLDSAFTVQAYVIPMVPYTYTTEQFNVTNKLTLYGAGLDIRDDIRLVVATQSTVDCSSAASIYSQSSNAINLISSTTGLTSVNVSVDTTFVNDYLLCYRTYLDTTYTLLGEIYVNKYRRFINHFRYSTTDGTILVLRFRGRGMNTKKDGDMIRVVTNFVTPTRAPRTSPTPSPPTPVPPTTAPTPSLTPTPSVSATPLVTTPTPVTPAPPTTVAPTPVPPTPAPPVTPSPPTSSLAPTRTPRPTPAATAAIATICNDATRGRFASSDLESTDGELMTEGNATWSDGFAAMGVVNFTVCYRWFGDTLYFPVGYITLPVANQPPEFEILTRRVSVRETSVATDQRVTLDAFITTGFRPADWSQKLTATVTTNASTIISGTPTFNPNTKVLTFTQFAAKWGTVEMNITVSDDGGTLYNGVNSTTRTLIVNIIPRNTGPTFTFSNSSIYIRQDWAPWVYVSGFVQNLLPGLFSPFEDLQNVTFSVKLDSTTQVSYFLNLPEIYTSRGTPGKAHLRYRLNPSTTKVDTIRFTVTAKDNGGTENGGVDTSALQGFKIQLLLVNKAPTFSWSGNTSTTMFGGSSYEVQNIINLSPGLNEAGQAISFDIQVTQSGIPIPISQYFTSAPQIVVSGTVGVLKFIPSSLKDGELVFTIRAKDNGGTRFGGSDTSTAVTFKLLLLMRFTLSVSPDSGGISFTTNFVVTVGGGSTSLIGAVSNELYWVSGVSTTFIASTALLLRTRSQETQYTTNTFPSGNQTVWALIYDSNLNVIDSPRATLNVLPKSSTTSVNTLANQAATQVQTDPTGALFSVAAAGSTLKEGSTTDTTSVREQLATVVNDAVAKLIQQSSNGSLSVAQATSAISSMKSVTEQSQAEKNAGTKVSLATMTTTTSCQTTILNNLAKAGTVPESTTSALLQVTSNLVAVVPAQAVAAPAAGESESAARAAERVVLANVAISVTNTAHEVLKADCRRQLQAAKSSNVDGTPTTTTYDTYVSQSFAANSNAGSKTSSLATMDVGGQSISYDAGRPSGDSCRGTVMYPSKNIFPTTGEPQTSPVAPVLTVSVTDLSSGSSSGSSVTLNFPIPSSKGSSDRVFLVTFSYTQKKWVRGPEASVSNGKVTGTITPNFAQTVLSRHLLQTSGQSQPVPFAIVVQPKLELSPCFPCVAVPVSAGLFVLLAIICIAMDNMVSAHQTPTANVAGGGLSLSHEQLAFLQNEERRERNTWTFLRHYLWVSFFIKPLPFSTFSRVQRLMCLFTIIFGVMFFITPLLDYTGVTWAYERTYSTTSDVGKSLWIGAVMAVGSTLISTLMFWLFKTADPVDFYLSYVPSLEQEMQGLDKFGMRSGLAGLQQPFTPQNTKQLPAAPDNSIRSILGMGLFLLWAVGCEIGLWYLTVNYNTTSHVNEYLITMAWGFTTSIVVLEILHGIIGITTASNSPPTPGMGGPKDMYNSGPASPNYYTPPVAQMQSPGNRMLPSPMANNGSLYSPRGGMGPSPTMGQMGGALGGMGQMGMGGFGNVSPRSASMTQFGGGAPAFGGMQSMFNMGGGGQQEGWAGAQGYR